MQDYAVVKIAHKQYVIEPGKTYTVDKFQAEPGEKQNLEVLAYNKNGKFVVGAPSVDKVKAQIEVTEQSKGKKVKSFKYNHKSRYRRRYGHRPRVTTFKVLDIK